MTRSYTFSYLIPGGGGASSPYDIQTINDTAAATHPWISQSHGYTYDQVDRLLSATQATPGNNAFAYDKLDNATTVTNPGSGTVNPTYNANNQIATWGANTYVMDANGDTLSGDGTKTYKWDAENRLVEIDYVGGTNKTVFTYDGLGRRTTQAETVSGTTTTTRNLWCPAIRGLGEGRGSRICQTRTSADVVTRRHYREGEQNVTTGQKLIYMQDQLGSVRDVIDATTGALVASYDYGPYGNITRSWGTVNTDYRYAKLFYHSNSGLMLAKYRALDTGTGRWLNRDPKREAAGSNLYSYVKDNPIKYIDPLGLHWEFNNRTGQWTHVDDGSGARTPVGQGYSGTDDGRNNPGMEDAANTGPIPHGTYDIGDAHNSPSTGPMTMNLTPRDGTDTHGRTLFRIHGDNADHDASEGCPIAPRNVRQMIDDSDDNELQVVN